MGVVYRGRHAMLRRPTVIKLLDVDAITDASIARFEREVQLTCQLNNPNTIAIHHFGRTPENDFYYAMEYLEGLDLEELVERGGPQPAARVVHLLLQMCGSLYEAHSLGLVHRDVKPANIKLARRGGVPDVVKVLDFGLVKAVNDDKQAGLTAANVLTGTPLYISPEAINNPAIVNARSDLYAVGAVGYHLLTGRPPFLGDGLVQLLQQHVMEPPTPSSRLTAGPVSDALEAALLACLEKNPANRPQTARDLAAALRRCLEAGKWGVDDGERWWTLFERGELTPGGAAAGPASTFATGSAPARSASTLEDAPPPPRSAAATRVADAGFDPREEGTSAGAADVAATMVGGR